MDRYRRPSLPRSDSFFNYPMANKHDIETIDEHALAEYSQINQNHANESFYEYDENPYYSSEWEREYQQTCKNRNASLRWNAALRQTLENMPSRTLPKSFTGKRLWLASAGLICDTRAPLEQHASDIAGRMERDPLLMDDSPDSEQLRQETLREMPQCLTIKRMVRKRLTQSVSKNSKHKPLSFGKRLKYRCKMQISKSESSLKNFMVSFELWYGTLKKIEGNFGSSVATYFKFLRWLFIVNFLLAIPAIGFVIIPQLLYVHVQGGSVNSTGDVFQWHDVFSGEGYFTNTIMYYGYYTNETVTLNGFHHYFMPQAYIFTMICLYIAAFIALSISAASSYRRSFIETKAGLQNVFAQKVFCGWDYNIATRKAAELKSSSLYNEFKELLSDLNLDKTKQPCFKKTWNYIIQALANLGVLVLVAVTGLIMWILLEGNRNNLEENLLAFIVAVAANLVMLIYPIIFASILRYENYENPRFALYVTLIRNFLLELTVVGVLITFWLTHAKEETCWETSLGQDIYRLILFDFLISVILMTIFDCIRFAIEKSCCGKDGLHEFNIASHTLQVIYNQTLFWVGFYFSPVLPVVVVIKLWLMWYIKTISTLKLCKPSTKSWRAAQTNTLFLILTFTTLFLCLLVFGYIMIYVTSSDCGPFKQFTYMYQVITEGAFNLQQNSVFWQIVMFFTTPGATAFILIALCVVVYFVRAKAYSQKEMVKILRNMLVISSKDKEFLLNYISQVTAEEWEHCQSAGNSSGNMWYKKSYSEHEGPSTQGFMERKNNLRFGY